MPHLMSYDATAVPAVASSRGAPVRRITDFYTITQAVSTSISVAMMALPAGAQVVDVNLYTNSLVPKSGSGCYGISVYNSLTGDLYIPTASAATRMTFNPSNQDIVGKWLTSSSNIVVTFQPSGFAAVSGDVSAVASCGCKLDVTYLTNKSKA